MLRKTILATTAGVMISPFAMAADVETPSFSAYVSDEYLSTANSTDIVEHPIVGFTIGAEYAVGDIIDLVFTGDALDETTLPTSVVTACDAGGSGLAGVTLGLLSANPGEATYRVTEVDAACLGGTASTVGVGFEICTFANPCEFSAQAIDANNGVNMSFNATTGTGLALDTGGGSDRQTDLFVTGSQFGPSVITQFDGIIDVNTERTEFTTGLTDNAIYNVDPFVLPDAAEGFWQVAAPIDQDVTVAANWSFLIDQDEATEGLQPAPGVVTWAGCAGPIAYDPASIAATCFFGNNEIFVDLDLNRDAGALATLDATGFASTHVINFEGIGGIANSITVVNVDLGAWGLNGFQSDVAYMPFQTGIGQVIYLANRGIQSGEITIDWIDQNGDSGSFSIGSIGAGQTLAIGPLINQGLPAAQRQGGRLALTITANVPACDAQLNAQYNVSGDRAFSVATDNCSP